MTAGVIPVLLFAEARRLPVAPTILLVGAAVLLLTATALLLPAAVLLVIAVGLMLTGSLLLLATTRLLRTLIIGGVPGLSRRRTAVGRWDGFSGQLFDVAPINPPFVIAETDPQTLPAG